MSGQGSERSRARAGDHVGAEQPPSVEEVPVAPSRPPQPVVLGTGRKDRATGRTGRTGRTRRAAIGAGLRRFAQAVEEDDGALVESEVLRLSQAWRPLAPLALCAGSFVMLFQGLRRVWTNWRLLAVEILPAVWVWAAMLDLKAHVLSGGTFQMWRGPLAVVLVLATALVTVAAFYLNAVFAFAVTAPETALRPAFTEAHSRLVVLALVGSVLGTAIGLSAFVVPRWGLGWFALALGISVAILMLASVVVPARLVGTVEAAKAPPRRDRLAAAVIAAVLSAVVCAPTYALGRLGLVLLDRGTLFVLGVILLVVGFGLESGTTGAVKAIKMSARAAAAWELPRATPTRWRRSARCQPEMPAGRCPPSRHGRDAAPGTTGSRPTSKGAAAARHPVR